MNPTDSHFLPVDWELELGKPQTSIIIQNFGSPESHWRQEREEWLGKTFNNIAFDAPMLSIISHVLVMGTSRHEDGN